MATQSTETTTPIEATAPTGDIKVFIDAFNSDLDKELFMNGNFGFIDEWHFINVQERLNELLAGNKLRTSTISNIKQTII